MCLNETYSKFRVGKLFCITFHIQNGLKLGDALMSISFEFCFVICYQ
jgi:hypothetical protein